MVLLCVGVVCVFVGLSVDVVCVLFGCEDGDEKLLNLDEFFV